MLFKPIEQNFHINLILILSRDPGLLHTPIRMISLPPHLSDPVKRLSRRKIIVIWHSWCDHQCSGPNVDDFIQDPDPTFWPIWFQEWFEQLINLECWQPATKTATKLLQSCRMSNYLHGDKKWNKSPIPPIKSAQFCTFGHFLHGCIRRIHQILQLWLFFHLIFILLPIVIMPGPNSRLDRINDNRWKKHSMWFRVILICCL